MKNYSNHTVRYLEFCIFNSIYFSMLNYGSLPLVPLYLHILNITHETWPIIALLNGSKHLTYPIKSVLTSYCYFTVASRYCYYQMNMIICKMNLKIHFSKLKLKHYKIRFQYIAKSYKILK